MFYNYVLQSTKNGNIYIGFTKDLKKRIKESTSKKDERKEKMPKLTGKTKFNMTHQLE